MRTYTEESKIETSVIIPPEFSLSVLPKPLPPLDSIIPNEDLVEVCAARKIKPNERFFSMSRNMKIYKLPKIPILKIDDVSINSLF